MLFVLSILTLIYNHLCSWQGWILYHDKIWSLEFPQLLIDYQTYIYKSLIYARHLALLT